MDDWKIEYVPDDGQYVPRLFYLGSEDPIPLLTDEQYAELLRNTERPTSGSG